MTSYKAVILDVDGTLVDSNDAHARAWLETFQEAGHEVRFAQVRPLIGMGGDKLMPEAIGIEKDSPEGERLSEARGKRFEEHYLETIQAFPQVRALLERLKSDGYRLVVASSAKGEELEPLLAKTNAQALIEESTSSSDAENSKPDPDIVEAAVEKLGLLPSEVVMLGDTPYDLEAATRAGVAFIGVRSGGWPDEAFVGALAVYADAADLLAHYQSSPLSPSRGEETDQADKQHQ